MSKSILNIDTPDCCDKCPCCHYSIYYYIPKCRAVIGHKNIKDSFDKPNWCPLVEVDDE